MKEILDLYRLVWKNHGGSKAFYRGELLGVALSFILGVLPWKWTLLMGLLFVVVNLVSMVVVVVKKAPEGVAPELFEKARMAMMIRSCLSTFMYVGFIFAAIMMYFLVTYFVGPIQTS